MIALRQPGCPRCNSEEFEHCKNYETLSNGDRRLNQCIVCGQIFSETKGSFLEGLKKPLSLVVAAFKARTEGMGLNATSRFLEISKNTLLSWEYKFADLKEVLWVYAPAHYVDAVAVGVADAGRQAVQQDRLIVGVFISLHRLEGART